MHIIANPFEYAPKTQTQTEAKTTTTTKCRANRKREGERETGGERDGSTTACHMQGFVSIPGLRFCWDLWLNLLIYIHIQFIKNLLQFPCEAVPNLNWTPNRNYNWKRTIWFSLIYIVLRAELPPGHLLMQSISYRWPNAFALFLFK